MMAMSSDLSRLCVARLLEGGVVHKFGSKGWITVAICGLKAVECFIEGGLASRTGDFGHCYCFGSRYSGQTVETTWTGQATRLSHFLMLASVWL
jgi:hypothetical protein